MSHYLVLEHPNVCRDCGKILPKGTRVVVEWLEHENHAAVYCDKCRRMASSGQPQEADVS